MNVQIIKEEKKRIVVQNFHLEGISAYDCLRRMCFFVSEMFREVLEDREVKHKRENLLKFYFLSVRLIRRNMDASMRLVKEEINPIEMIDLRMAAEKVNKASTLLQRVEFIGYGPDIKEFGKNVLAVFEKTYNAFFPKNFDRALKLWDLKAEMDSTYNKIKGSLKRVEDSEALNAYYQIYLYCNDIALQRYCEPHPVNSIVNEVEPVIMLGILSVDHVKVNLL